VSCLQIADFSKRGPNFGTPHAFELEGSRQHPMLAALPPVICVRGDGNEPLPWLASTIELVSTAVHAPGAGGAAVLERVSEVLLGQALRTTLLELRQEESLHLEALYDRGIAPAVRAIHEHPEHAWTVGELGDLRAMSRSAFAARFRTLTGDSPIRYVARCPLARAARELRTTDESLGQIARTAGYESVFAFSRASKRAFGVPPRAYRARFQPGKEPGRVKTIVPTDAHPLVRVGTEGETGPSERPSREGPV
jgi:AraC-like DNA-binding protein